MSPSGRVFFHHLQKTAGTSFRRILVDVYGESAVSPKIPGWHVDEAVRSHSKCMAIGGHMCAMPGDVLPRGFYSVTVLREPIDRFLSEFHFSKYDFRDNRADLIDFKRLDLDAFLETASDDGQYAWNLQVETLYPYGCSSGVELSSGEKLLAAKRALELFDCVGVQEEFADFVDVVSYDLRWPVVNSMPRENITTRRISSLELSEVTRRRIAERVAPDVELHAYAHALFRRKRHRVLQECVASRRRVAPGLGGVTTEGFEPDISTQDLGAAGIAQHARVADAVEFGDRQLEIVNVAVVGSLHEPRALLTGEQVSIVLRFRSSIDCGDFTAGISIRDSAGRLVFGTNTRLLGQRLAVGRGDDNAIGFGLRNDLAPGKYTVDASLHRGSTHLAGCYHWRERATDFEVVGNIGDHFEGQVKLYPEISIASEIEGQLTIAMDARAGEGFVQQLDRPSQPLREFLARIKVISEHPREFLAGDERAVRLEITNLSTEGWRAVGIRPVRIGFHWLDVHRNPIDYEGIRTTLPRDVNPGEVVSVWCVLRVPNTRGEATLVWTLVQEEVAWFDAMEEASSLEFRVQVLR